MVDHSTQYLDGWHAQRRGLRAESNPYDDQTQGQSRREWDRGWYKRKYLVGTTDPEKTTEIQELDATVYG